MSPQPEFVYTEARPRFRTAYGAYSRLPTPIVGESLTKQSMAESCDINTILDRFRASGELTHVSEIAPSFIDALGVPDYRTALNNIIETQTAFDRLPSAIRNRFDHSAAALVDFLADPANAAEAAEMGFSEALESPTTAPEPAGAPEPEIEPDGAPEAS